MQIWVICRYSNPSGISGFYGFPCRDASLRNEGCFFLVPAGRSLLRSTTVPERNRGRSPCITARVFIVFVGKEYEFFMIRCAQTLRSLRLGERITHVAIGWGQTPPPRRQSAASILVSAVCVGFRQC